MKDTINTYAHKRTANVRHLNTDVFKQTLTHFFLKSSQEDTYSHNETPILEEAPTRGDTCSRRHLLEETPTRGDRKT